MNYAEHSAMQKQQKAMTLAKIKEASTEKTGLEKQEKEQKQKMCPIRESSEETTSKR